jgi:hypothetical protein
MRRSLLLPVLAAAIAGPVHAAEGNTSLGIGVDYSSGDYGTDVTTEILSVPLTLRHASGNWSFRASVPWVRVSGDPNVLPTVGLVPNLNPIGRGRLGPIGGAPIGDARQPPQRGTASGLGDLTLGLAYSVATDRGLGIDLGVNAKIATADEDKGLGTGANDYGVGIDLYRDFDGTMLFGGVGQVWLGSSKFIDVDSIQTGNAGISQQAGRGRIGVMYEHRTATARGLDARRDVIAFYSVPTTGIGRFQLYASRGLSDASPDWGAGIAVSAGF